MDIKLCLLLIGFVAINQVIAADEPEESKEDAAHPDVKNTTSLNDEGSPASGVTTSTMPSLVHGTTKDDESSPIIQTLPTTTESATSTPKSTEGPKGTAPTPKKKMGGQHGGSETARGSFVLASLCLIFAKALF